MFDSSVIDVGIGLVFVFLMLSLVASAAKEGLEAIAKRRAKDLEKGIKELVGTDGTAFVTSLYDHGLINSLFAGTYGDKNVELPSYIPSKNFALALLDLRNQSKIATPTIVLPAKVKQAFQAFELTADQDIGEMQKQVEDWYNSSMDRVSGWYKRRSQWWVAGIGLVLTVAVNVDCVAIAKRLSTDKTLREAVVQAAQQKVKSDEVTSSPALPASTTGANTTNPDATIDQTIGKIKSNLSELDGVGLPIGWKVDIDQWHKDTDAAASNKHAEDGPGPDRKFALSVLAHVPGWLLTALAVSLGAPFWFDILNKIMVVRSTVKPHEKSKEEGSKDGSPAKPSNPGGGIAPAAS